MLTCNYFLKLYLIHVVSFLILIHFLFNRRLVSLGGKVPVFCARGSGSIPGRTNTQDLKVSISLFFFLFGVVFSAVQNIWTLILYFLFFFFFLFFRWKVERFSNTKFQKLNSFRGSCYVFWVWKRVNKAVLGQLLFLTDHSFQYEVLVWWRRRRYLRSFRLNINTVNTTISSFMV